MRKNFIICIDTRYLLFYYFVVYVFALDCFARRYTPGAVCWRLEGHGYTKVRGYRIIDTVILSHPTNIS